MLLQFWSLFKLPATVFELKLARDDVPIQLVGRLIFFLLSSSAWLDKKRLLLDNVYHTISCNFSDPEHHMVVKGFTGGDL